MKENSSNENNKEKEEEKNIIKIENESFDKYLNNNQIISVKTIKINKDYLNFGDVNNNIEFDTLMKDIENINKKDKDKEKKGNKSNNNKKRKKKGKRNKS